MLVDDERRNFMRLVANTDVTITRLASGDVLTARLVDISACGCGFRTHAPIELGEELEILVQSPSERIEPFKRSARVARLAPADSGTLVGVEFADEAD